MPGLMPHLYIERSPYHERFQQSHFTDALKTGEIYDSATTIFPDIPDDLILPSDRMVTTADWERLHADSQGDAMYGYAYGSQHRLNFLAAERAAVRLGVAGIEQLDPYVARVLRAQQTLGDVVLRSALESHPLLPAGGQVLIKQEADQSIGAFKIRGAHYKMQRLSAEQLASGVIAASAGNHAQGVAYSAYLLGTRATLVMPVNTPEVKVSGVRQYGAVVHLIGNNFGEATTACAELQAINPKLTYVSAFDDEDVMIGQATIAAEILQQNSEVTHVVLPVGGGGLLAGVAKYLGLVRPDINVLGVEPTGANGMTRSLRAGRYVESPRLDTVAEGAAAQPGHKTFNIVRQYLHPSAMINVSDREIAHAVVAYGDRDMLTEAAGALALAGLRKYTEQSNSSGTIVAIRSGRNIDKDKLDGLYQLARLSSD